MAARLSGPVKSAVPGLEELPSYLRVADVYAAVVPGARRPSPPLWSMLFLLYQAAGCLAFAAQSVGACRPGHPPRMPRPIFHRFSGLSMRIQAMKLAWQPSFHFCPDLQSPFGLRPGVAQAVPGEALEGRIMTFRHQPGA